MGVFAWLSLPRKVGINMLIWQGRTLTSSWICDLSSGLTDGSQLPHHVPLIQIRLEYRVLKGSEIPGDIVSFIPFTYLKKYLLRACVQKLS